MHLNEIQHAMGNILSFGFGKGLKFFVFTAFFVQGGLHGFQNILPALGFNN